MKKKHAFNAFSIFVWNHFRHEALIFHCSCLRASNLLLQCLLPIWNVALLLAATSHGTFSNNNNNNNNNDNYQLSYRCCSCRNNLCHCLPLLLPRLSGTRGQVVWISNQTLPDCLTYYYCSSQPLHSRLSTTTAKQSLQAHFLKKSSSLGNFGNVYTTCYFAQIHN